MSQSVVYVTATKIYTIHLPSDVTLGEAYEGDGGMSSSRDLLQWMVGLQLQPRRRLFVRNAKVAAYCAHAVN